MKAPVALAVTFLTVAAFAAAFAGTASASSGHKCQGDPPIQASARTSCSMAANVFEAFYSSKVWSHPADRTWIEWVNSPVTHRVYRIDYRWRGHVGAGALVTATGPNGIRLTFRSW